MQAQGTEYRVRNYRPGDFEGLLRLYQEAERSDRTGRCPSSSELRERLRDSRFAPEEDLWVAVRGSEVAGLLEMSAEVGIKRLILSCLVHPLHRRRGLASRLLDAARHRATEVKARVAHVNVARHNRAGRDVLKRLQFSHVRTFLELRARTAWVNGKGSPTPQEVHLRPLRPGEEALLARLQNRCFEGTWGFNPNTADDIHHTLSMQHASISDVTAAFRGEEPVAYCWVHSNPAQRKGRIHMLGVVPRERGKGLAGLVLGAGVSSLRGKGVEVVELTTDGGNLPACRLYFAAGFRVWSETLWYERPLPFR